jgi:hypothetical protein
MTWLNFDLIILFLIDYVNIFTLATSYAHRISCGRHRYFQWLYFYSIVVVWNELVLRFL